MRAEKKIDVIYVTASTRDARFTRICVASIRHFYPNAPVKLLIGGELEEGLVEELARYWDVGMSDVPPGQWGWGFVKLEPLFGPCGERFLVLDSDTVFAGKVLETWANCDGHFLVDDEHQTEADTRRLYYDWRKVAAVDPAARSPQFVFNSGQWFGTAGQLSREDFAPFIDWSSMPPKLRHAELFMPGDQGVLNYVINQKIALDSLAVARHKIMRWPGNGMDDLSVEAVKCGKAPPLVIHWAGMKAIFLRNMVGADLLNFYEAIYFSRLPMGHVRRALALWRHVWIHWTFSMSLLFRLRLQRLVKLLRPEKAAPIIVTTPVDS